MTYSERSPLLNSGFLVNVQQKCKKQRKDSASRRSGDDEKKKNGEEMEKNEPPSGYIHVRARRGQATDSHSLAERVHILLLISHYYQFWYILQNNT